MTEQDKSLSENEIFNKKNIEEWAGSGRIADFFRVWQDGESWFGLCVYPADFRPRKASSVIMKWLANVGWSCEGEPLMRHDGKWYPVTLFIVPDELVEDVWAWIKDGRGERGREFNG